MPTMPTIHLNGTSARDLLKGYSDATRALTKALEALAQCAPNGRDYYPQGDQALRQAISEHSARADRLRESLREIEAIAEHIADQA